MPSASKAKGSAFERSVVEFLRGAGFPQAARTLAGAREDRGDVSGVSAVLELKNCREMRLGPWMNEAKSEALNAGVPRYLVVHKRKGVADVAESYATMPLWLAVELLRD